MGVLDEIATPVVLAPLAGGPSTPELAAAVSNAGGLGFLAAGYLSTRELATRVELARATTNGPLGVNLFVPRPTADPAAVEAYRCRLAPIAAELGVEPGPARHDDDGWDAKLELLRDDPVAVVSFTFGCPPAEVVRSLQSVGSEVWVSVTSPDEAAAAAGAGVDAVVAQGIEAGGHRATWDDRAATTASWGTLPLLRLVTHRIGIPTIAAGGIATGAAVRAVRSAGAVAALAGTAFVLTPEAGTSRLHRDALRGTAPTVLTRAFTGRTARAIRNRFVDEMDGAAPACYPEVHHVTAPIRQAGREHDRADVVNFWAGESYSRARAEPAAAVVARLADGADV